MDKALVRKEVRKKLAAMTEEKVVRQAEEIADRLFGTVFWREAAAIAVTISTRQEVPTAGIIRKAWEEGKRVAVPKCDPVDKTMEFRYITSFRELETVYFGLQEPIISETEAARKEEMDLMIVPGLAFDRKGYRIGFGGGYYDRYLEQYDGMSISLLFPEQMYESIEKEQHDIPVSVLVFPKEVITVDG